MSYISLQKLTLFVSREFGGWHMFGTWVACPYMPPIRNSSSKVLITTNNKKGNLY